MISSGQLKLMSFMSCFTTALGDTGGVPYNILQTVLEKYDFLHNHLYINCVTFIPDI